MDSGAETIPVGVHQADWRWTHGFVDDVGAAIALAATHPMAGGRTYNVGESRTPTFLERLQLLAEAAEWRGEFTIVPDDDIPLEYREPVDYSIDIVMDSTRMRQELDFSERVEPGEAFRRTSIGSVSLSAG